MIFAIPHIWIPPERPAIVRLADLNGLQHPWSLAEARDDARRGVFPFPLFVKGPSVSGGNDSFTKILLHLDGADSSTTIIDSNAGGAAHAWTNNVGSIATAQSRFNGSSYNCGAMAGWVDTPDHADFTVGSGDFTADVWFYRSGGDGAVRLICGQCASTAIATSQNFHLSLSAANVVQAGLVVGSTTYLATGTTAFTTTGWNHTAMVRTVNTLKLFVNGIQEGGDIAVAGTVNDAVSKFSVGRFGEFVASSWYGFLDEFRLSVGIARWTANFTPAVMAYN